jgi:hypothetical protein
MPPVLSPVPHVRALFAGLRQPTTFEVREAALDEAEPWVTSRIETALFPRDAERRRVMLDESGLG